MKRTLSILLAVCMLMALAAGCGAKEKGYALDVVAENLESSGAFSDILSELDLNVASMLYGFDSADVSESKLLCSTGATTEEIGLFKCVDEDAAKRVLSFAEKRAASQRKAYESYAPAEMPKLDDAIIRRDGVYVFYIVSYSAAVAEKALNQ